MVSHWPLIMLPENLFETQDSFGAIIFILNILTPDTKLIAPGLTTHEIASKKFA